MADNPRRLVFLIEYGQPAAPEDNSGTGQINDHVYHFVPKKAFMNNLHPFPTMDEPFSEAKE